MTYKKKQDAIKRAGQHFPGKGPSTNKYRKNETMEQKQEKVKERTRTESFLSTVEHFQI